MRASKTLTCRVIQYHSADLRFDGAIALRNQIVRYVAGIRGERKAPVSAKQIVSWFRGTDAKFVNEQLTTLVAEGRVCIAAKSPISSRSRAHNSAYVYWIGE